MDQVFINSQLRKTIVIIASFVFILSGIITSHASDRGTYDYIVRPSDTLSEITLMYAGTHDYFKIAQANDISNPDLILPGDKITLPLSRPVETLREYLRAIYNSKGLEAYKLLSTDTRSKFAFEEFQKSLKEVTFYDLNSMSVCGDFIVNSNHILQIKVYIEEDPASWGFNLIREKYKWYVLLFDLNPTFPRYNGFLEWECH